jgi:hypothetical protein
MFFFVVCISGIYYRIYSVQICNSLRMWRNPRDRIGVWLVEVLNEPKFSLLFGSHFCTKHFWSPFLMNINPPVHEDKKER